MITLGQKKKVTGVGTESKRENEGVGGREDDRHGGENKRWRGRVEGEGEAEK